MEEDKTSGSNVSSTDKLRKLKPYIECWLSGEKFSPVKKAFRYLEYSFSTKAGYQMQVSWREDLKDSFFLPRWEKFTSVLAVDLLEDMPISSEIVPSLLLSLAPEWKDNEPPEHRNFNFFTGRDVSILPDDVDDSALCAYALFRHGVISPNVFKTLVENICRNVTHDSGIIQSYLEPRGTIERTNNVCSVVCANAMRLLYYAGVGSQAKATEDYLLELLISKKYENHYTYYSNDEFFLYFLAMATKDSKDAKTLFERSLLDNLAYCIDKAGLSNKSPLASALRILTAEALGVLREKEIYVMLDQDKRVLQDSQLSNGSWPKENIFHTHRLNFYFGSEEVTSLFAARALKVITDIV